MPINIGSILYSIFFLANVFFSFLFCRWFSNNNIESLSVISGPRIRVLGPVLAIEAVTNEDAGTYKCLVSNTGGEATVNFLIVSFFLLSNFYLIEMKLNVSFVCS